MIKPQVIVLSEDYKKDNCVMWPLGLLYTKKTIDTNRHFIWNGKTIIEVFNPGDSLVIPLFEMTVDFIEKLEKRFDLLFQALEIEPIKDGYIQIHGETLQFTDCPKLIMCGFAVLGAKPIDTPYEKLTNMKITRKYQKQEEEVERYGPLEYCNCCGRNVEDCDGYCDCLD